MFGSPGVKASPSRQPISTNTTTPTSSSSKQLNTSESAFNEVEQEIERWEGLLKEPEVHWESFAKAPDDHHLPYSSSPNNTSATTSPNRGRIGIDVKVGNSNVRFEAEDDGTPANLSANLSINDEQLTMEKLIEKNIQLTEELDNLRMRSIMGKLKAQNQLFMKSKAGLTLLSLSLSLSLPTPRFTHFRSSTSI
jgi:hypothetical protein